MTFRNKNFLSEFDPSERERIRSEQVSIAYKQAFASVYPLLIVGFSFIGMASLVIERISK